LLGAGLETDVEVVELELKVERLAIDVEADGVEDPTQANLL
jgi:hypothetical protein